MAGKRSGRALVAQLGVEHLEPRTVLSAASFVDANFQEIVAAPQIEPLAVTQPTPVGMTPALVRQAYRFDQIQFGGGTIAGDGAGTTIAIVDAYNNPNIASDLHVFDQTFGLPDPPSFLKVNQNGGSAMPATNAGWSQEIALDVEWAHAIAPKANILLVEANSASISDLLTAVDYARRQPGVVAVSMSWGSNEFGSEANYSSYFTTPAGHAPVTFIASSGDNGAGAIWPAVSPNVLAVGGTALINTRGGGYASETAWSGSGGGYSRYLTEPGYQSSVQSTGVRTTPDVAYNSSPNTGFAVYDTVSVGGRSGWFQIGGTSAAAPQWAGLVAIADQGRALSGKPALANVQSLVYALPGSDFHDVQLGGNGYSAGVGYDLVTGRGSPYADSIVRDLIGGVSTTTSGTTTGSSGSTSTTTTTRHPRFVLHFPGFDIYFYASSADGSASLGDPGDIASAATALAETQITGTASPVTVRSNAQGFESRAAYHRLAVGESCASDGAAGELSLDSDPADECGTAKRAADAIFDSEAETEHFTDFTVRHGALHAEILGLRPHKTSARQHAWMSATQPLTTPAAIDAYLAEEAEADLATPALAAAALRAKADSQQQQAATDVCLTADADRDALERGCCATCDARSYRWRWYDPLWAIALAGGVVSARRLAGRRGNKALSKAVAEFDSLE